jgi:chemotaxis protein methyltransferase CheR
MVELGIVDIREIIRLIKENYNFDFSNYALTSLKYRLEHVIAKNNMSAPESLFRKLSDQRDFFDTFLNQISVSSTEMFRDPSFWRVLRESFFPSFDEKYYENFKIWLPLCVSGAELYTLTILLKEINLLNKVKIYATTLSKESLEFIKSGVYPLKKIEVSGENYIRFQGDAKFEDYYREDKYNAVRDTSLIKNVEFIVDDINFNNAPKNVKLILLRNAMIYFNPTFQDKVLIKMHEVLSANGHLAIGLKEQIKNNVPVLFEPVNLNENIYKKKLV